MLLPSATPLSTTAVFPVTTLLILTFESLWSSETLHTSLYLVTSHARSPFQSFTRETGSVARRRANSAGGSRPEARSKGNEGGSRVIVARGRYLRQICGCGGLRRERERAVRGAMRFIVTVGAPCECLSYWVGFIGRTIG